MGTTAAKVRPGGGRRTRWVVATIALLGAVLSTAVVLAPSSPAAAVGDSGGSSISAGLNHSCGVTAAGGATCWGSNASGQLGNNSTTSSSAPVPVSGLSSGATAISAGSGSSSCAVASGGATCWGSNTSGQLGNNSTAKSLVPVPVQGLTSGVTAVSVGTSHACAVVSGAAWCWGSNANGQLGNNSTTASLVPVPVQGLTSGVTSISAGNGHSCAVVSGAAWCWGLGANGQLGNNSTAQSLVPVQPTGLTSGITAISAGVTETCAVASGAAKCWGLNQYGGVGDGTQTGRLVPTQVSGLTSGVTAISAGRNFACGVVSGAAWCWGNDEYGQLGNSTISDGTNASYGSTVPVPVTGLTSGVTTIAAGWEHACSVGSGGTASCWGRYAGGKTGTDYADTTPVPQQVSGLTSGAAGLAGSSSSTCAVVSGAARCWGSNFFKQVANTLNHYVYGPNQPSGLGTGVTAVASGGSVSCAVVSGAAKCWGEASTQLGIDVSGIEVDPIAFPTQVVGLTSGVTAISAGSVHTCAVASGAAKCWGSGANGRLGDNQAGSWRVPTQVSGLTSGVTAIAAGGSHSCAAVSGAAKCWGSNTNGRLGNNATTQSLVPVQVQGLTSGVTAIAAGGSHSCAVVSGAAWCWGSNASGQLGNNSTTESLVPVQVQGLTSGVTAIAAGTSHTCAVVSGAVKCWGSNASFQSGGATTASSLTPIQVTGLTFGAGSVSAGLNHSCAEVSGAAVCWGRTTLGSLGAMDPSTPAAVQGGLTFASGALPAAPTISGSRSPLANGAGWNNEPVTVSFTCSSSALASCTSPVTVSADGADQSVTGTATDTAAQSASTTVSGISIDRVAPTLSGITVTPANNDGWYKAPVTMDWTCDDALSGIAAGACPASSATVGEGTAVSVSASVTDRAGNQTTASSESVKVDLTKPSTGVSSPPTWSSSDVTLTLSPTDALSGVASTFYKVDGDTTQGGTAPVISGQGTHSVEFWSVDVAGNEESHQSVQVRIDVQAPSITADRSVEPNGSGWNKTPVTVTFDCGDEPGGSGLASCSPPQSFPGEVDTSITGTAADTAGNTASVQVPVRIDQTAPTVTADVPAANANGWFNAPVQVPFTCSDSGGSGVASCPAPIVFAGEGADQPVTATGSDLAGNEGTASGATVSLDTTNPTISGAALEPGNGGGGFYGAVTVHWTCDDALSGVVACPADVAVSGEGTHEVTRSVTDRAGNTSTAQVTVRIDHDPSADPGTVSGVVTDASSGNPVAGATVTLRTPAGAVVATTTSGTDGAYTFPAVADGSYRIYAVKAQAFQGSYRPGTFTVSHGVSTTADHALAPMLVVSGTVRSSTGTPISGATVRVAPAGAVAVTDAAGNYQVNGLLPGAITVKVLATGFVAPADVPLTISGSRTLDHSLVAAGAGSGVKGTITNRTSGAPLSGATVRVWVKGATAFSQTLSTGTDGRFSIASLPVGTYEIDVVRVDYQIRWFGDVLSRSSALPVSVTAGCTSTPDPSWGDPCAVPASIRMG